MLAESCGIVGRGEERGPKRSQKKTRYVGKERCGGEKFSASELKVGKTSTRIAHGDAPDEVSFGRMKGPK